MEHSTAIMEDAGKAVDQASRTDRNGKEASDRSNNYNQRKRKGNFNQDAGRRQGSHKRRDGDVRDNKRHQKGDMGRGEYHASNPDKRDRTDASRKQREAGKGPGYGTTFSTEEIEAEERRPKRKVAVLIGYSGTGYKGMQLSATEKTIEGDLFKAFIAAGAVSKANADDPKKASLVRCARTDKGVHAAGNMISLKLIVEDEDIVQKINDNLSSQIRVWGIERTIGSFSCYQACDSRWYEYLIPSYAFLPPYSNSWLAKKLEEMANQAGDTEQYKSRQKEVEGYWEKIDEDIIKPILETIDEDIRPEVIKALQGEDEAGAEGVNADADEDHVVKAGQSFGGGARVSASTAEKTEEAAIIINEPSIDQQPSTGEPSEVAKAGETPPEAAVHSDHDTEPDVTFKLDKDPKPAKAGKTATLKADLSPEEIDRTLRLREATKRLRQAYTTAKRQHRIPAVRVKRIQDALDKFVGTANYHNYTVQKTYRDPSAKRHIKSFVVNKTPILIGDGLMRDADKSEWLSLKVHGQSFMMHQIRKMIGMVALLVRSGSDLNTLTTSLGEERFSIPKVPGLGLLLERPVFDSYNTLQAPKHERPTLDFDKFEKDILEFKEREIYKRIFREEEERNEFGRFFNHVDNFKEPWFLYVGSGGLENTKGIKRKNGSGKMELVESDDEVNGGDDG